jgi:ribosomal protein S18 acetylase RimI-like enzyme
LYVYKDNDPAIHIYKKYGFKIIGVEYDIGYYPDEMAYKMQRDVQSKKSVAP